MIADVSRSKRTVPPPDGKREHDSVDTVSVEVVKDAIRFGCLRDEWEQLAESSTTSPFQTFDWCYLWWRYFGGTRDRVLHVLLFRIGDDLVGIAPLFQETLRFSGKPAYRRLRFLGRDIPDSRVSAFYVHYPLTDYFDFVVAPGSQAAVADAFVAYLQAHPGMYDELEFVNLPKPGFLLDEAIPRLQAAGFIGQPRASEICPRIRLGRSFDEYLNSIDGNHRRRLRQAKRAYGEEALFSLDHPQSSDELNTDFAELVRLHQRRWNKLGSPGLFHDRRFELFQADVMNAFHSHGWMWMRAARKKDTVIAVRLCFVYKNVFYDYLSGVDDEAEEAKRRPGLGLLVSAVEDAIQRGIDAFDMLRGGEQYKLQLANETRHIWEWIGLNPGTASTSRIRFVRVWRLLMTMVHRLQRERLMLEILSHCYGIRRGTAKYLADRSEAIAKKVRPAEKQSNNGPAANTIGPSVRSTLESAGGRYTLVQKILKSMERDREIPFMRKVFKGVVFFRSLLVARVYLMRCDKVGKRCRTRGRPLIVNDGRIVIGNDFNLSSRIVRSELATGHKGFIEIGDDVSLNFGALLSSQHHVKIGNNVRIGPYSIITDSDFHTIGRPYNAPTGIPTIIEDNVWLGARVTVLKGSKIGTGSVISAGSVVAGEIPANVVAAGVPARVVKQALPAPGPGKPGNHGKRPVHSEVVHRVRRVFSETFGLSAAPELFWSPRHIARWDSLGHLNLVLNLEAEFQSTLSEEEVMNIMTVQDACQIMNKYHGNGFGTPQLHNETL